jgi:carbon monoxide dehydrogenase subunit G
VIQVVASINIRRTPEEVFAYLSNFENNPKWQSGMISARFTSSEPLQVGSTYSQEARFLGRPVISEFEVVEYVPERKIKITSTSGTFPITVTRLVEPDGEGGSRVSAVVEGDASGVYRLAEPMLKLMVQRSVRGDYERLKSVLEGG